MRLSIPFSGEDKTDVERDMFLGKETLYDGVCEDGICGCDAGCNDEGVEL
jgi:hypothetical protein